MPKEVSTQEDPEQLNLEEKGEVTQITEEVPTQKIEEKKEEVPTPAISVEDIVLKETTTKKGVDTTPKWFKDRIDELTTKIYEKDSKIKELEAKAISSERPIPPAESDFMETGDYKKARIEYEDKLDTWKTQNRKNEELQEKKKQEATENVSKFNERALRMREKYPDFDKSIEEPVFTPEMSAEIMASEYGAEIGYYLAKNPAEALKLSKLSLTGVAKEIGKLEIKFTQALSKIVSDAPPPLEPLKGDDVVKKDPSKMSTEEWMAWDKQQTLERIKTRGVI